MRLDNEGAEIGVGCIGVLIYDRSGNVTAGLSVSAPIERRQYAWITEPQRAGVGISRQLGYTA
ncbi:MAG: IclR family transcriptional regulator C-terminal domain-containing protein [Motiliproteus sp.]